MFYYILFQKKYIFLYVDVFKFVSLKKSIM
jgi:hypothetical protein